MLHQAFNSPAVKSFYERRHWAIQVQITAKSIPRCGLQNMTQTMSSGLLRNHKGFGISYGYSKAVTNHSFLQQGGWLLLLKDNLLDLAERTLSKVMPLHMLVGLIARAEPVLVSDQAAQGFTQLRLETSKVGDSPNSVGSGSTSELSSWGKGSSLPPAWASCVSACAAASHSLTTHCC